MSPDIKITVESENGTFKKTHLIPEEAVINAAVDITLSHINLGTSERVLNKASEEALMDLAKSMTEAVKGKK